MTNGDNSKCFKPLKANTNEKHMISLIPKQICRNPDKIHKVVAFEISPGHGYKLFKFLVIGRYLSHNIKVISDS